MYYSDQQIQTIFAGNSLEQNRPARPTRKPHREPRRPAPASGQTLSHKHNSDYQEQPDIPDVTLPLISVNGNTWYAVDMDDKGYYSKRWTLNRITPDGKVVIEAGSFKSYEDAKKMAYKRAEYKEENYH